VAALLFLFFLGKSGCCVDRADAVELKAAKVWGKANGVTQINLDRRAAKPAALAATSAANDARSADRRPEGIWFAR
jgi:hypothetical protein